ncbi:hypothetical protein GCM10027186_53180 [Micromonospora schwarzwaldensis]
MQRLLRWAGWDVDAVRDDVRGYVVEHLGDPTGVLIVDDTGFLKKGTRSAGVQRQYSGTAGRTENCQVGTFLAYRSSKCHALVDRQLYLPASWTDDRDRCRAAGIPDDVEFATKVQMAQAMLARAFDAGVPVGWVTMDEAYGQSKSLRLWLEHRDVGYVPAPGVVPTHLVMIRSDLGLGGLDALLDRPPGPGDADQVLVGRPGRAEAQVVGQVRGIGDAASVSESGRFRGRPTPPGRDTDLVLASIVNIPASVVNVIALTISLSY